MYVYVNVAQKSRKLCLVIKERNLKNPNKTAEMDTKWKITYMKIGGLVKLDAMYLLYGISGA